MTVLPAGYFHTRKKGGHNQSLVIPFFIAMNDDKRSFILYADLEHTVSKLPDNVAGQLFKLILQQANDKEPEPDDLLLQIAFEPIRQQMKRDAEKWQRMREKQSENGRLGGRPKKANAFSENPKNPPLFSETQKSLNVNANVTANGNDTVNVKEKNTVRRFTPPTREDVDGYAKSEMIGSETSVDKFHDYYTANGWKVGRNAMKDWKAAFRNWIKNEKQYQQNGTHQQAPAKYDGVTSSRSRADWEALKEWGVGIDEYRDKLFSGVRGAEDTGMHG